MRSDETFCTGCGACARRVRWRSGGGRWHDAAARCDDCRRKDDAWIDILFERTVSLDSEGRRREKFTRRAEIREIEAAARVWH